MTFQYYNTLKNKSKNNIVFYLEQLVPKFTEGEISTLIDDLNGEDKKKSNQKSDLMKNFIMFEEFTGEPTDYSNLSSDDLEKLYKIFVSKEISDKKAVKWRFFKNLKYIRDFKIKKLHINRDKDQEEKDLDFIIETETDKIIFTICYDVLEIDEYMEIINGVTEIFQENDIIPDEIIIATNRSYRNIPIKEKVTLGEVSIEPQLWVEWVDLDKPFNEDDLLIVRSNEELNLAGYNFSNIEDLLDYVYNYTEGGQISVYRQVGYFAESVKEEQQVQLIWKGIMIKKNL
jgi:hypothetical protein